jgi:hypothetical protein
MQPTREIREVHMRFWWGNLSEKNPLEDLGINRMIILKRNLQEMGWGYGLYGSG